MGIALGLFFDYLPHRPFNERNRWKNARVYPSPLLNILILGQNYHLIHHLWPSIPWYKVQPAYYQVKPLLDHKECHQTLGLFEPQNFLGFLYDLFIGIRLHHGKSELIESERIESERIESERIESEINETEAHEFGTLAKKHQLEDLIKGVDAQERVASDGIVTGANRK